VLFSANAVALCKRHGYKGLNLDFEPSDPSHCRQPNNCTLDGEEMYAFLRILVPAMHAENLEVSTDYDMGDHTSSRMVCMSETGKLAVPRSYDQTYGRHGSYSGLAATGIDHIMLMDT
jgi:hypothetical protein